MNKTSGRLPATRIELYFGIGAELISLLFLTRLIADTSIRMFTPFLPDLSAGLGLTITAFSWILTVRSVMGLISPFIGALADRFGRRLVLVAALGLRAVGLVWLSATMGWGSLAPMLLLSLTSASYYPVLRAYVSDLALPERRARALAIVDASFPTAGILGLPLVGWMIEGLGWSHLLLVLGGLNLLSALVLALRLPSTERQSTSANVLRLTFDLVKRPQVVASFFVSTLLLMIFTLFFLFWALLLSEEYDFSPVQIGLTGTLIGVAELVGLIFAGLVVDRLGKRRGTLIGLAACALLLPLILIFRGSLFWIRSIFVLFMFAFEFGITASIPLIAEQTVDNRATLFCLVSIGNSIGAGISPPLVTYFWSAGGSAAIVLIGSLMAMVAIFLVWRYLFDHGGIGDDPSIAPVPEIHII